MLSFKLLAAYLLTMLVFCVLDIAWIGFVARDLYRKQIGHLLSNQVNWVAIVIFYLLYIASLFVFTILPAVEHTNVMRALLYGALFGAVAYATYDLTNLGTMKNWPVLITVIDIAWGAVITAVVSCAGFYIVRWIQ